ncbi:MAG: hypothetical protein LBH16_10340 [Treponema sp.]|jgi:hypothetical protein|nr:hypothetical protein [Treponema sp.]
MNITLIILFFCLSFCLFIFFYFKWYIKKRTSDPGLLADYKTEVDRLNAEINSVTDRNLQLVEDRIGKLKALLDDTDRRIAVYARELDKSRSAQTIYTSLGKGIRAAFKTPSGNNNELPVEEEKRQVTAPGTPEAQPVPKSEGSLPDALPVPRVISAHEAKRQIRAQLEEMIDKGFSPAEIAARLHISLAEVDLAMNLRRSIAK